MGGSNDLRCKGVTGADKKHEEDQQPGERAHVTVSICAPKQVKTEKGEKSRVPGVKVLEIKPERDL